MAAILPYGRVNALNNWFDAINDLANFEQRYPETPTAFKMDVQENPDGYIVEAHVPGIAREEIDVELNAGRLVIDIDHKDSEDVEKRNYVLRETSAFHATRGVYLKDADTAGLTAVLKDGVLTVNVPKRLQNANVTKVTIG